MEEKDVLAFELILNEKSQEFASISATLPVVHNETTLKLEDRVKSMKNVSVSLCKTISSHLKETNY